MANVVLCRGCWETFPAPTLASDAELRCPHCGCDILKVLADEVQALLEGAGQDAARRAGQLPPLPPTAPLRDQHLWREVRQSYILGQFAAALLLGSAYLEHALNAALGRSRRLMLRAAIDAARREGLIDAQTAANLAEMASRVRNAYAHGDVDLVAGVAARQVTTQQVTIHADGSVTRGPVETTSLAAVPIALMQVKADRDAATARPVLQTVRWVACTLLEHERRPATGGHT
jgi:hypothetical protein